MPSQVEYFCSESEEAVVLDYLATRGAAFSTLEDSLAFNWRPVEEVKRPAWNDRLTLLVWNQAHGQLVWHEDRPRATGPTHRSLVLNLLAQEEWDSRGLHAPDRLLDADASPVMFYKRPGKRDGRLCPCSILAAPSNLDRIGEDYSRWVRRVLAWVRRRGTIVHDYRTPSPRIPNPTRVLNTIYAWPGIRSEIEARPEEFVIWSE